MEQQAPATGRKQFKVLYPSVGVRNGAEQSAARSGLDVTINQLIWMIPDSSTVDAAGNIMLRVHESDPIATPDQPQWLCCGTVAGAVYIGDADST